MPIYFSTLSVTEYFTINFICNYMMEYYPFDIQECNGTISIDDDFFVRLVAKDLSYTGTENLMKYNFKNISFIKKVKLKYLIDCWYGQDYSIIYNFFFFPLQSGSSITFMITMKRLIITEFLTTMLPTILIVLVRKSIVYSSNYIW